MTTVTVTKSEDYRLQPYQVDPTDNQIKIIAGPQAIVRILAPLNWLISGQKTATLQNSQYVVIQKNNYNKFQIVQGNFLATTPLDTNTIPYSNVTGAPGPITPVYFTSIVNQVDYVFDGTISVYNPLGLDLRGRFVPMFSSDGLLKVPAVNYTWDTLTGTLSIIGKVYDDVQYILFYQ